MAQKKRSHAKKLGKSKPRKSKPSTPDFVAEVPQAPPVAWAKSDSSICPYSDEVLQIAGLMVKDNYPSPLFQFSLHGAQIGTLLNVLHDETEKIIGDHTWQDVDGDTTQLLHRALAIRGCLKLAFLHCERDELQFMLGQILQAATLWITRDERYTRFRTDVDLQELRSKRRNSKAGLASGPQAKSDKTAKLKDEAKAMAEKIRQSASTDLTNHQLAYQVKQELPRLTQKVGTIKRWFDQFFPPRH